MRVLVTGSNGLIGSEAVLYFDAVGANVRGQFGERQHPETHFFDLCCHRFPVRSAATTTRALTSTVRNYSGHGLQLDGLHASGLVELTTGFGQLN
jgi:nucleoside-diphosphate-sugar epimerase